MNRDKRFCPYCGAPLEKRMNEGRERLYCPEEKRFIYDNPIPAATAIVANNGEILLVYRNIMPGKYQWALPGGFIETGESPEEAARRELMEETGLKANNPVLIDVIHQESKFYKTSILIIGYYFQDYEGEARPGDDAKELSFFPLDSLPELAFESHTELVKRYRRLIGAEDR